MLRVVIIDDEPDCVRLLSLQLKLYCPSVQLLGSATDSEEGLQLIQQLQPNLLFLDVEMPVMNGFQLLEKLGTIPFQLVFVTAYDRFAVKAFRYSALDYLLKPIDGKQLQDAVNRAAQRQLPAQQQLSMLKKQLHDKEGSQPDKIALPFQNGVAFTELKNIVYCSSENNYTRFFTTDGQQYLVAKTLGDIQETLEGRHFLRVHRQYVVNLDHIRKYVRGEGNYLVMSNNQQVPVARNQKERLIDRFGWL